MYFCKQGFSLLHSQKNAKQLRRHQEHAKPTGDNINVTLKPHKEEENEEDDNEEGNKKHDNNEEDDKEKDNNKEDNEEENENDDNKESLSKLKRKTKWRRCQEHAKTNRR